MTFLEQTHRRKFEMELTLLDRSNYLKGLLVVAKKDNQLTDPEKIILKGIAKRLGFATDFYEDTIRSLLTNKYISEKPIKFSNKKIAESFVSDGLNLAFSDQLPAEKEIDWLRSTASVNDLNDEWFNQKIKNIKETLKTNPSNNFALLSII